MFTLEHNLCFVNIDIDYLKALHAVCPEVPYREKGYEHKPFIGLLVWNKGQQYAIPLSSAKPKHITWKNATSDRFLIYETTTAASMTPQDIFLPLEDASATFPMVKHIFSVIDLKKMIPVNSHVFTPVYINPTAQDSVDVIKYKILLTKELRFCIKIKDALLKKASKLYQRQITTGKVIPFCVDFKRTEQVCNQYTQTTDI